MDSARYFVQWGLEAELPTLMLEQKIALAFVGQFHKLLDAYIDVSYDSSATLGAPQNPRIDIGGSLLSLGIQARIIPQNK